MEYLSELRESSGPQRSFDCLRSTCGAVTRTRRERFRSKIVQRCKEGKKGKVHSRTGHEGPEGE